MLVLGIESSCDECAASVVRDGAILTNCIATQVPVHARYGGVVPELASRAHILDVVPVIEAALQQAEVEASQLDAIAVTQGPGLVGSLLVGIEAAKALAYCYDLPLLGMHHIEAHLMAATHAVAAPSEPPSFPFVGLVVSGGHTSLFLAHDLGQYTALGHTLDDAAGEALDKVGKMLGLGYPGGIHIDKLSRDGDPKAFRFPRALPQKDSLDFSFSGLKTSVLHHLQKEATLPSGQALADLCAAVLEAVVDVLVKKTLRAARKHRVRHVVISGGVSANQRLRAHMRERAALDGINVAIPPLPLCTDNAAMVAGLAHAYLVRQAPPKGFAAFDLSARASWPLA